MLNETNKLIKNLFGEKKVKQIYELISQVEINYDIETINRIWLFDRKIKGIGGYCIDCEHNNEFIGYQQLVEYLKKIRNSIESDNLEKNKKEIFEYLKEYLIELIKLYLFNKSKFGKVRFKNIDINNSVNFLKKTGIAENILDSVKNFIKLYDKSKLRLSQVFRVTNVEF
ncbi:hypothetical protein [Streptococcus dysgalactiae]|uniref:hypothetical protein n=1 Tax=Streptococcus dysgalactiae TaxID=1334 RepID=UPI002FC58F47